jgi:hypothetical protein
VTFGIVIEALEKHYVGERSLWMTKLRDVRREEGESLDDFAFCLSLFSKHAHGSMKYLHILHNPICSRGPFVMAHASTIVLVLLRASFLMSELSISWKIPKISVFDNTKIDVEGYLTNFNATTKLTVICEILEGNAAKVLAN